MPQCPDYWLGPGLVNFVPRLASNLDPPQPPLEVVLQARATVPSLKAFFHRGKSWVDKMHHDLLCFS
jgi:hypothetical protein